METVVIFTGALRVRECVASKRLLMDAVLPSSTSAHQIPVPTGCVDTTRISGVGDSYN